MTFVVASLPSQARWGKLRNRYARGLGLVQACSTNAPKADPARAPPAESVRYLAKAAALPFAAMTQNRLSELSYPRFLPFIHASTARHYGYDPVLSPAI